MAKELQRPLSPNEQGPIAPAPAGRPPRRRRSRIWLIVVGVIVVAVAVIAMRPKKPLEVTAVTIGRGDVAQIVSSSAAGEVKATRQATLRAEVGGHVVEQPVRRGDRVAAGALLVRIDDADLRAREREVRAAIQTARANESQARERAEAARRELERARELVARGVAPQQTLDRASDEAALSARAAEVAAANVAQSEAALASVLASRSKVVVRAPFAATVAQVSVNLGDDVVPGAPLVQIVDDTDLYVEAPIDEADARDVREGLVARVLAEGMRREPIDGRVRLVSPLVTRDLKGTRQLLVEVNVPRHPGLRPGMSADIEIVVARRENVLSVPTSAIVGRGAKRSVFVAADGFARKREIEVGVSGWERTEVTTGLREGDRVIDSLNTQGLDDAVRVKLARRRNGGP